jgi:hypothetical protein
VAMTFLLQGEEGAGRTVRERAATRSIVPSCDRRVMTATTVTAAMFVGSAVDVRPWKIRNW